MLKLPNGYCVCSFGIGSWFPLPDIVGSNIGCVPSMCAGEEEDVKRQKVGVVSTCLLRRVSGFG